MKTGLPMSVPGLFTVIIHITCQQYPCKYPEIHIALYCIDHHQVYVSSESSTRGTAVRRSQFYQSREGPIQY